MTQATSTDHASDAGLVAASERWVEAFGTATLEPADAADLVESARRITQAVARAARHLAWQAPDAFTAVMRQAEHSSDC